MGLGRLFSPKRSKPGSPEPDVKEEKTTQKENDVPLPESSKESPKLHSVNVAYPFHSVKATTFPPPLSIDASVFTDTQNLTQTYSENKNERSPPIESESVKESSKADETEQRDEIKSNKIMLSSANGACDSKSCTKENCKPEMCENTLKKQHDSEEKITPIQLTEMINSSIKEAMQTIVKQCRMEEKKDADKKPKKEFDKSVCYANKEEISLKAKQFDRSRSLRNNIKSACHQEKYNNVRSIPKKSHDESGKSHVRKENVEERRAKRHLKPMNNVKTDNRKMTGNVNIYICSEATENAQATSKQKKASPCTETSSETTTNQSNVSSCKLVSHIRKKRRESKECDSLDFLPKREESSDNSNDCSCLSKYTDSDITTKLESNDSINMCNASDEIVSVQDTDSNLTACQCKDANISNSDVMIGKSNSTINDKLEPCATIFPSKTLSSTDSDKWSLKSICNSTEHDNYGRCSKIDKENVLCDEDGRDTWSLEQKSISGNYYVNNFSRDYGINEGKSYNMHSRRDFTKTCKCHKKDQELLGNCNAPINYRSKRHKTIEKLDSTQPWSTCSCIVEEEEEDTTVCKEASEDLKEQSMKFVTCKERFTDLKESSEKKTTKSLNDTVTSDSKEKDKPEQEPVEEKTIKNVEESSTDKDSNAKKIEETKEQKIEQQNEASSHQRGILESPFRSPKLLRPEAQVLKLLLQQQGKPTTQASDQENVTPSPIKYVATSKELTKNGSDTQTGKKAEPPFLRKFNLPERYKLATNSVKPESQETIPQETIEKKSEDEDENKGNQGSEEMKETSHGKLKQSLLFKMFRKLLNRTDRTEAQSKKLNEDKTTENTLTDTDAGIRTEIPEPKSNANSLPRKSIIEEKETHKENRRNVPVKTDVHKTNEETNQTQINVDVSHKMLETKENKKSIAGDETSKTLNPIKKRTMKENERKTISDGAKESQSKSKLLASIINRKLIASSTQNVNVELTKRKKSQALLKESNTQQITKKPEIQELTRKSEIQRMSHDQEKKQSESSKATGQVEIGSTKEIDTKVHSDLEKEETTVCVECRRRKSSTKVSKQAAELQHVHPRETESHRLCMNSKFTKCSPVNDDFIVNNEQLEDNSCNYCLRTSECNNELINYPKSCLKKGNQFCRIDSQESNLLTSHYDNRSWEDCGCRRVIACDNCCRPRNECSCRLAIICVNCCKPKLECNCKPIYKRRNNCRYMKSMFCLYCDNPREKCSCRAPMQKCSCCELSIDLCVCKDRKTFCEGRPVSTEPDSDRTMYVTAWKPRDEVRRYFSRNLENHRVDSINECCCHKLKSHNSDELPYQRLSVFSDVMNELQQKMSESSCCAQCRKIPCCCNIKIDKEEGKEERKIKYCVSPKTRRKIVSVCKEKLKDKSPNIRCKCDPNLGSNEKSKKVVVHPCCACNMTPCRCKKSNSNRKKPKAKCYYCKTSPCTCITSRERSKSRPCRCADSPSRVKEKEIIPCGKTSTKPKNNQEKVICVR